MFGGYPHAYAASFFLGQLPTSLTLEVYARYSTHTANEPATGFGFVEDGGAPETQVDHFAYIYTDGANFTLESGAASDAGAADDGNWHLFKVVITSANVEWFIDGTSQGTIALEADEFPVSFGAYASTTNRFKLGQVHIFYT